MSFSLSQGLLGIPPPFFDVSFRKQSGELILPPFRSSFVPRYSFPFASASWCVVASFFRGLSMESSTEKVHPPSILPYFFTSSFRECRNFLLDFGPSRPVRSLPLFLLCDSVHHACSPFNQVFSLPRYSLGIDFSPLRRRGFPNPPFRFLWESGGNFRKCPPFDRFLPCCASLLPGRS